MALPGMLLRSTEQAVRVFDRISHPNVQLIFDTVMFKRWMEMCSALTSRGVDTSGCCNWPTCRGGSSQVQVSSILRLSCARRVRTAGRDPRS